MEPDHLTLPPLRSLARHALPHLVETTVVPLTLFYTFLLLAGIWGAIAASLAWTYLALARRLVRRQRLPGLLVLGAVGLTARTVVAFVSGSVFFYLLQPSLMTMLAGGLFLLSVPTKCPLAERVAGGLLPLPASLLARPAIRRVFIRITVLWAFVNVLNAAVTVGLLLSLPVAVFMITKTVVSLAVTGAAIWVSAGWFVRTARQPHVTVVTASA